MREPLESSTTLERQLAEAPAPAAAAARTARALRALFIIRDSFPSPRPDVLVLFGKRLPERGIRSDVVATGVPKTADAVSRWPAGSEFVNDDGAGTLKRLLGALRLDLQMLRHAEPYDAIVVRDKILTAWLALRLCDPARVFFWMSYPFPEDDLVRSRIALTGRLHRTALRVRGWLTGRLLYRGVVPRAAHVFVQSEHMRAAVARRSGRAGGMTAIPMGVDEALLAGHDATLRIRPQPGEPLRLVYLGSLDRSRHIGFLLEVLQRLHAAQPGRFHLTLVGGASTAEEYAAVQAQVRQMALDELVRMTGQVSRDEAWAECARCHIGLSAIPRGELFDVSSPTKAVEYLAMGLPVVVNDIPDQAYLIEHSRAGLCAPMDVARFAAAIEQARDDYPRLAERALQARRWVIAERGYDRLADTVAQVLAETLPEDPPAG
ncbi:MAG TPA: glycosyltransferase [Burkholderiaceae bacterium]|nr:glycosyltransferase [Burkholderiaceae bacterium]